MYLYNSVASLTTPEQRTAHERDGRIRLLVVLIELASTFRKPSLMFPAAAADIWRTQVQLGGKGALWVVSHFRVIAFKTEFDPFKICPTLPETIR